MPDEKDVKEAQEEQIKAYKKLSKISDSQEFKDYFEFQLKTVADKMIWAFTTGKDGDNVKNWDDFCRVRGEVIARLHPIQEVNSAPGTAKYLKDQLDRYYAKQV